MSFPNVLIGNPISNTNYLMDSRQGHAGMEKGVEFFRRYYKLSTNLIYTEKLQKIIIKNKSNLVIGLDPDMSMIPSLFLKYKNPVLEFNKLIIESTKDIVAGYKPNMAFYECLGEQ